MQVVVAWASSQIGSYHIKGVHSYHVNISAHSFPATVSLSQQQYKFLE